MGGIDAANNTISEKVTNVTPVRLQPRHDKMVPINNSSNARLRGYTKSGNTFDNVIMISIGSVRLDPPSIKSYGTSIIDHLNNLPITLLF